MSCEIELERRSERWGSDPESARAALSAAVSLLLRPLGRDPDPAKSREHVLLSVLAERRLVAGQSADLSALLDDLAQPPIEEIGALVDGAEKARESGGDTRKCATWRPNALAIG